MGFSGQADFHFPDITVLLGVLLLAIESLQVAAFQLANGGVYGVATGSGIVECPLRHLVHSG